MVEGRPVGRLEELFDSLAAGVLPPPDECVEVIPSSAAANGLEGVLEFTAHSVVVTSLPSTIVASQAVDAFGAASSPDFLRWLAGPHGWIDCHDVLLIGAGTGRGASLPLWPEGVSHPRAELARELRSEVEVYGDERGIVTLGRGFGRRLEISIELSGNVALGHGIGGRFLAEALSLLPAGEPVFASVAPGNARSLRCFLRNGFVPVGAEVLLRHQRPAVTGMYA